MIHLIRFFLKYGRIALLWSVLDFVFVFPSYGVAPSALTDTFWLKKIEDYLNTSKNWKAHFEQFNPDGSYLLGTFFISRPGKLRLMYTYPSKDQTLMADGRWLIIYSAATEELTTLPLNETPAYFLLQDPISFSQEITVKGLDAEEGTLKLTLIRTQDPEAGHLQLIFQKDPLRLIRWTTTDAQRMKTTVKIKDMQPVPRLDPKLFVFERPDLLAP